MKDVVIPQTNHSLHLILSIVTLGLWAMVWTILIHINTEKIVRMILIDQAKGTFRSHFIPKTNHTFHVILSILTSGGWIIIWTLISLVKIEKLTRRIAISQLYKPNTPSTGR